ncbi:DUF4179 domain-containing protein [Paenibacillus sp. MER 180]|uniref:DUF4179 domain-containing protein n=1 Tax=unclassified Paenibacillus TaxID=185978 RepID=UPI00080653F8|nr:MULTISPECIES: DUF4179 domain-containing protein [unclassified Paenibacillus]MCM3293566.1 DUF4179 domain-containing protein [Paenibacillus sp. MER 180]OBY78533.1 hypothetical protein BBG47_15925 [Paenibacillus sp. KS1]
MSSSHRNGVDSEQLEAWIRQTPTNPDFTGQIMSRLDTGSLFVDASRTTRRSTAVRSIVTSIAAAAAAFVLLIGGSFLSPTVAESMRHVPGVSSLFRFAGDLGLQAADEKGLVTSSEQSLTHHGLTLSIPVAAYDGVRVAVGIERSSLSGLQESSSRNTLMESLSDIQLLIDGKSIADYAYNQHSVGIITVPGENENSAILMFSDMRNQEGISLPDKFDLTVKLTVSDIQEPYQMTIPVSMQTNDSVVMKPNISKSSSPFTIKYNKVELTPVTTSLAARLEISKDDPLTANDLPFGFEIYDDKGRTVKLLNGSGLHEDNGKTILFNLLYQPYDPIPTSITIKPYISLINHHDKPQFKLGADGQPLIKYIPELEVTLPVEISK